MSLQQERVVNKSAKCKLVNSIIKLIFENGYILFGGAVRDYHLSKQKTYPVDFDIGVSDISLAIKYLVENLKFCFDIETNKCKNNNDVIVHAKLNLKYKFPKSNSPKELIEFCVDISDKSVVGSNLDFDVNGVYMTNDRTYNLVDSMPSDSLCKIIDQINKKRFSVLKTYVKPNNSRFQFGISENSKKLVEFIKIMERVCKMLNRGWKLNGQNLEEIFDPCLIKEMCNENDKHCTICGDDFKKYELELYCCKKIMCFVCAIAHVKSRFNNSEIPCPYCRGDPFGWKTINDNPAGSSNENNFLIQDEWMEIRDAIMTRRLDNTFGMETYDQTTEYSVMNSIVMNNVD